MSRPFQVDLSGVIELLSRHIYSSPRVYLRELIQNGVDAINAATTHDALAAPLESPRITITPARDGTPFTFRDNGIGLTADEAAELLATVGKSSKRDPELGFRRDDYLGQFGIGLLSCFMVSDNITILSRSRRVSADGQAPAAIEWVGRIDGTFTVTELDANHSDVVPYGTTVSLTARHDGDDLLTDALVAELATTFAEFLPIELELNLATGARLIGREAPFLPPHRDTPVALSYGREVIGQEPLAAIPLDALGTGTSGVGYILPFAPPPGAAASARVYLSRMLLAERMPDVLPAWASFVHAVISTDHLTPTASREQLIANEALTDTQEAIGRAITYWVQEQALHSPETLAELVNVHHVALRQMAAHYDDLGKAIIPLLPVETSAGTMSIGEYLDTTTTVRYASTVDEFRQVSSIVSPERPVINAGYSFIEDLLLRLPTHHTDVTVEKVEVTQELNNLSPVPFDDATRAKDLEKRATEALGNKYVTVITRTYEPANLPALYVADPQVIQWIERDATRDVVQGPWAEILAQTQEVYDSLGTKATAQLCLNWSNRAVRSLAAVTDPIIFTRSVRLLFAQAKLSGHHPLTVADRTMLTEALDDLITLSIGLSDTDFPEI
ncbi:HSP90 family protein [Jonesia quinghaiensis]|uniref:HSP90 family protein n=1 Tax=Jonesia quinghaiensis TaxID=262806 RepID=UPI000402E6FE|nr:HSP90 family protein [Jonesia quinghaiensis]